MTARNVDIVFNNDNALSKAFEVSSFTTNVLISCATLSHLIDRIGDLTVTQDLNTDLCIVGSGPAAVSLVWDQQ